MTALTDPFPVAPDAFDGPVLVTGAGGCLGAWAVAILQASGVPVVAFDLRDDRRRPAMVMGEAGAAALAWETGDITDGKAFADLCAGHGIRAIIHLAALQVPFCAASPALGARVNVEGTINVLEAARALGIRRTAFASSVAAHGMAAGSTWQRTLYGAYKLANEQSAAVYWQDWQVPSICLRPNVVYGVGRDQGVSAGFTLALQAAARGESFDIPFTGPTSWLYAGEAAAAFIAAVSRDGDAARVFDLNGRTGTVEAGLAILRALAPDARITASGGPFPFPADMDDAPVRAHLNFPQIGIVDGIAATWRRFVALRDRGRG
ncbi:MAG: NAD-dependent epimerase/dehydratase family protein [Rubellimicrobium sp.]|nr:NAD-dependent epimerase/dehydratase family protein [Rubellimicrobium sp.]